MVICDRPIVEVCPVEWGRMPGTTVLQWDKDDCAAIDLVKFDLLGLGMLSALHYAYDMIESDLDISTMRLDDPEVYAMLQRADSVGRVPGGEPRADGHTARLNRTSSTTWWWRWR
jgi:error-prone DNA polymerase